jgi:hypothetical protein
MWERKRALRWSFSDRYSHFNCCCVIQLARREDPMSPLAGAFVEKPPIVAYVTFHTVAGRHACLTAYPRGWLNHFMMSPGRMLRDTKLIVRPAPAPASLAWEHIGASKLRPKLYGALHFCLAALFLLVPFVVIHLGRKMRFQGFLHGQDDGLVRWDAVKSCKTLGEEAVPSVHCVCSWRSMSASSSAGCQGWLISVTLQALGPLLVRTLPVWCPAVRLD